MKKFRLSCLALAGIGLAALSFQSQACSRFTYTGQNNLVITGRSMDWMSDVQTNLWALPAGLHRVGATGPHPLKWTSRYGSVVAAVYDMGTADGMNTAGLDANLLYLANTQFPANKSGLPNLDVLNWVQYMLDNYATVDQAVKDFSKKKFNMLAPMLPGNHYPSVHLALTDKSGDNAIFEYVHGKLIIHHGKQYKVMTNEPDYDQQLALNDYWQSLKGSFLPGTTRPEDRYVRASYYLGEAPQTNNTQMALATVFSIIRNVSTPYGARASKDHPNIAPTLWVSVADLKDGVYYFQNTNRPNVFWVDLSKLDLKKGAPVKRLALAGGEVYAGDASDQFVAANSQ
ncbi:MAG: choloylglycine hydrolase [Gammaproteobacteria bacterium CG11_big_fil_rev_8_21_14_0_20_46_22]|nr:MAG: choloylglycine hydrolase [Gammaproteobacteria bacterium CG12_big_fil_rev_8_21_14_0_65_46_12]PIR11631.1 MAG: choloylglycine hydrolase [Gammaproteobacteria bacterium CG11_big_fil_rev_8_21_14_0_20_46_22]